jgi:hypothetical protein
MSTVTYNYYCDIYRVNLLRAIQMGAKPKISNRTEKWEGGDGGGGGGTIYY